MKNGAYHTWWFVIGKFDHIQIDNNEMQEVGYTLLVLCIWLTCFTHYLDIYFDFVEMTVCRMLIHWQKTLQTREQHCEL